MANFSSLPINEIIDATNDGNIDRILSTVLSMTSNFSTNVSEAPESDSDGTESSDNESEGDNEPEILSTPTSKVMDANGLTTCKKSSPMSVSSTSSRREEKANSDTVPKIFVEKCLSSDATSQAVNKMLHRFNSTCISTAQVEVIEDDLSFYEKVSMVFLLYDSDDLALQRLITAFRSLTTGSFSHCRLLSDWALHESSDNWSDKFLEALAIIGNYAWVQKLGHNKEDVNTRFLPQNRNTSLFVDLMRKALYHMCESLSCKQLEWLQKLVEKDMENEGRVSDRYDVELMEMNILHWMSQRYLKVGVVGSCDDGSIKNLTKHLKVMEEYNLVDYIESIARRCRRPSDPFPDNMDQLSVRSAFSQGSVPSQSAHSVVSQCQEGNSLPLLQSYVVNPRSVGFCVIINQKKFYKEKNPKLQHLVHEGYLEARIGTDVDRDRLCEVFLSFGFSVRIWENLTHIQLLQAIQEAATTLVKRQHSCFALCILSHGRKNAVYGVNSIAVDIDEIEKLLHGKYCPNLLQKPKIIIIQACQGLVKQRAIPSEIDIDGATVSSSCPEVSDTLIFWSTVRGFAAFRDRITGSWFIKAIWEEMLRKSSQGLDILSMFVNVNAIVCSKRAPIDGELKAMTPQFTTSFRGKLVLPYNKEAHKSTAKRMYERYLFDYFLEQYLTSVVEEELVQQKVCPTVI